MSMLGPSYQQQQDYYNQQQQEEEEDWRGTTSQQVLTRINRPPPPLTLSRGNSAPDLPTRQNGKFIMNPSLPIAMGGGGSSSYDGKSFIDPSLDFNYINVSLSNMSLSQGNSPTALMLDMNNHKQPLDIDGRTPIEDIFSTSPSKRMSVLAMAQQQQQQQSPPQHSGSWGPGPSGKKIASPVGAPNSKRSALEIEKEINGQNLYKTELCRSFVETGACRYGSKCQFAHGRKELRPVLRHPKYKTEICKTFHTIGTCPYGTRCRFIHKRPDAEIADNSVILPVPPGQPGMTSSGPVSNPEWAIWKDGLSDGTLDGLAPQQQHLLTMNGLNGSNGGISLMKAFPGNGLSSSHDRILLAQHAANALSEDLIHGENGQQRSAISAIDRRRSHESGKKKGGSGSGSGSGGTGSGSGSGGKDKRKSKSTRSRTKSSPSGRRNHRRRKSTGDDDDYAGVDNADHENDNYNDRGVGGSSVGASRSLEIPPIVDAGPDTEEDEIDDEPLPVAPVSPKPKLGGSGTVAPQQHRPRTLSAKERLPIFQVLCTDADEESVDSAADPAAITQKVLSSSS